MKNRYCFRLLLNIGFVTHSIFIKLIKDISVEILRYGKDFYMYFYFIFMICYFLLGGILYVYRREYYDIFIIFVRINKYIFYGGGITLFSFL